jgi:hypothetical protein
MPDEDGPNVSKLINRLLIAIYPIKPSIPEMLNDSVKRANRDSLREALAGPCLINIVKYDMEERQSVPRLSRLNSSGCAAYLQ